MEGLASQPENKVLKMAKLPLEMRDKEIVGMLRSGMMK
jgi:hypothetical protein